MTSDEQVTMDGASTGQDAPYLTLTCPFAARGDDSYNPPFCNIVQEGSWVNLTVGSLSTETRERFIMVAVPDTTPELLRHSMALPAAEAETRGRLLHRPGRDSVTSLHPAQQRRTSLRTCRRGGMSSRMVRDPMPSGIQNPRNLAYA